MKPNLKFFINLDRDQLRASSMQQAFASCKYQPLRFNAVDWQSLSATEQHHFYQPAINKKLYFRSLTAGECGCYASHMETWRMLVESDAPWALILEDDVEPTNNFDAALEAIDALPQKWDIVKLIGREKEKVACQRPLSPSFNLVQYSRIPILASAYVISRAGAEKLLMSRRPFARPIDVDLRWWWENDLRVFGLLPYPVRLANTSDISTIGERKGPRNLTTRLNKARMSIIYNLNVLFSANRQARYWQQFLR